MKTAGSHTPFIGQTRVVYLLIAVACTGLIEQGWSKWLYLVFFLALWNALKFLLFGPWSLVLLVRVKLLGTRNVA